jgi:hypothetical protein
MFERRRSAGEPLPLTQTHRRLRSGENIPPMPGLLDQIAAFRADVERARLAPVVDELDIEPIEDDEDEL